METVTNIASTASTTAQKMIWGDKTTEHNETGGQEPISGQQGKGTINEPFDQGNKENPTEVPSTSTFNNPSVTADKAQLSSYTSSGTEDKPSSTFDSKPSPSSHTASGTQDDPISISDDSKPSAASHSLPFTDNKHTFTSDKHTSTDKTPFSDDKYTSTDDSPFLGNKKTSTDETPFSGDKHTSSHDRNPFTSDKETSTKEKHSLTDDEPKYASEPPRVPKSSSNATSRGLPNPNQDSGMPSVVNKLPTSAVGTGNMTNPSDAAGLSGAGPPGPDSSNTSALKDQEGAEKPVDEPKGQQENAIKESKLSAEELLKKRDPNDHSGEPMHMHDGGDKGVAGGQDKADTSSNEPMPGMSSIPATQAERRDSKIGLPGGQEHGKEYGTGDRWEKTSGLAAEGGDFDATKPGAGREADRLMAQKGIHKTAPGEHPTPAGHSSDTKDKVSMGEKIKNKLHIGSHK